MSAEAKAPQDAAKGPEVAFQLPQTEEAFRMAVANAVGQVLSVPSNIQALAASMFRAGAAALDQINVVNQRLEAQPQLTRTEYPKCLRATVLEGAQVGEYDVKLEQRGENNEWVPAQRPDYVLAGTKKLVLSQPTFAGDVWYLTTTAEVHAYQDSLIGVATGDQPPAAEAAAE